MAQGHAIHALRVEDIDGMPVVRVLEYVRTCNKITGCSEFQANTSYEKVQLRIALDATGGIWLDSLPWPFPVPSSPRRLKKSKTSAVDGQIDLDLRSESIFYNKPVSRRFRVRGSLVTVGPFAGKLCLSLASTVMANVDAATGITEERVLVSRDFLPRMLRETSDPFVPVACPTSVPLATNADIASVFGAGQTRALLSFASEALRTSYCHPLTGCEVSHASKLAVNLLSIEVGSIGFRLRADAFFSGPTYDVKNGLFQIGVGTGSVRGSCVDYSAKKTTPREFGVTETTDATQTYSID